MKANNTNNTTANNVVKNLANARAAHKELKGTPCSVIKALYAESEEETENGRFLRSFLPKDKKAFLQKAGEICKAYKVGETKETARGSYVIKFSADMVLRYLAAQYKLVEAMKEADAKAKAAEKKAANKESKKAEKKANNTAKKAAKSTEKAA